MQVEMKDEMCFKPLKMQTCSLTRQFMKDGVSYRPLPLHLVSQVIRVTMFSQLGGQATILQRELDEVQDVAAPFTDLTPACQPLCIMSGSHR